MTHFNHRETTTEMQSDFKGNKAHLGGEQKGAVMPHEKKIHPINIHQKKQKQRVRLLCGRALTLCRQLPEAKLTPESGL